MNLPYNKVVFYNNWHLGDLHVSRQLVNMTCAKLRLLNPNIQFSYARSTGPTDVLLDIKNKFGFIPPINLPNAMSNNSITTCVNDTIFINTWYGPNNRSYINKYGVTFDCLYHIFNDVCKTHFQFSLDEISHLPKDFFPRIDFSHFYTSEIDKFVQQNQDKRKVFISNGDVRSFQCPNFPFGPIINALAKSHPDTVFILSNKTKDVNGYANVRYSSDIIKKPNGSDLNENAYLSNYCDTIIGRASGAYTFAYNYENVFDHNKKIICFLDRQEYMWPKPGHSFWHSNSLSVPLKYSSEILVFGENDVYSVTNVIEGHL